MSSPSSAGTGFVDYFLIVWDFINWAREQNIPVGPGRGSGGLSGRICLKITDIDPLSFGLLFERMLNLERVSSRLRRRLLHASPRPSGQLRPR